MHKSLKIKIPDAALGLLIMRVANLFINDVLETRPHQEVLEYNDMKMQIHIRLSSIMFNRHYV